MFQPIGPLNLGYEVRAEEDLSRINRQQANVGLTLDSFSGNLGYAFINKEAAYGRPRMNSGCRLTGAWG